MKIVVGALGVLIAVSSGVVGLFKFQEHWLQYRTTAESLNHHKYLFLTNSAPYDKEEPYNLLVENIEGLISKENSSWVSFVKENHKEKGPKKTGSNRKGLFCYGRQNYFRKLRPGFRKKILSVKYSH